jgi:hypothetical protein
VCDTTIKKVEGPQERHPQQIRTRKKDLALLMQKHGIVQTDKPCAISEIYNMMY